MRAGRRQTLAGLGVALLLLLALPGCPGDALPLAPDPLDEPDGDAVLLSLSPVAPARVGETVDLVVRIANADDVVSAPFRLRFDPARLEYQPDGARAGPFLEPGGQVTLLTAVSENESDVLVVGINILGASAGVSGAGDLLFLRFRVLDGAPGTTPLTPFAAVIFQPGLRSVPVLFPPVELPLLN